MRKRLNKKSQVDPKKRKRFETILFDWFLDMEVIDEDTGPKRTYYRIDCREVANKILSRL